MRSVLNRVAGRFRAVIERGGVLGASLLGAFCPVCIPAIGAFLASIGLGFLVHTGILWGLMVACLLMALFGLGFSYFKEHRNPLPLLLGLSGSVGIYGGRYLLGSFPLIYLGAGLFIGASVLNWYLRKKTKLSKVPPCCAAKGVVATGGRTGGENG